MIVDEQPAYPGGMDKFYDYINANLKYPCSKESNGVEGKVFIEFVVRKDGSIDNVKILKGLNNDCDAQALKLVHESATWKPGIQRGRPVNVRILLPIIFKPSKK
jgi:periplasmic protein TonB